jgi:hypothetical protein
VVEQNTAKSAAGAKTADEKRPLQILNLFVMCSSSLFFLLLARRLCGKQREEAIPQESLDSLLNLPSYFSEKSAAYHQEDMKRLSLLRHYSK